MKSNIQVVKLRIDLVNSLFCSARGALDRAKRANPYSSYAETQSEPRISSAEEIQATVETCTTAFFTVEAALNRIFFESLKTKTQTPFDKWLKSRWRFGLSILDKITLPLHEYANTDFTDFPLLREIFVEFTNFRNRLVHTAPQEYELLLQYPEGQEGGLLEDVYTPSERESIFPRTNLSKGIWLLNYYDAAKCYEIMLLMLTFFSSKFNYLAVLWWDTKQKRSRYRVRAPKELLEDLQDRFFPQVSIDYTT